MATTPYARPIQSRPRAIHLVLRDGDSVDGGVYLTDGQALAPYLSTRKNGWVNVVNATWSLEGEVHPHAVLQTEHILLASASQHDYPVVATTQNAVPRAVDLLLENGMRIQGNLLLGAKQRLSDYLASTGTFIALLGATRVQDGDRIGDVAVNSGCVKAVRDSKVFASEDAESDEASSDSWGGMRRTANAAQTPDPSAAPVNRERVTRPSGQIEVVTPGRTGDRRATGTAREHAPVAESRATGAPVEQAIDLSGERPPTAEHLKRAATAARHWLSQLAVDARLAAPDGRDLSASPTLEEIWRSIAVRNDMADAEIAVMIAMAYKLEMADLEQVTPAAVSCIPAKIARRLGVLPIRIDGRTLRVAVSDPESLDIEQQLGFVTRHQLQRVIATPADIAGATDWYYADGASPSA